MQHGSAIISDDCSLMELLGRQLRELRGWELARSSLAEWRSGETHWVRPNMVFLDLRNPDSPLWSELAQLPTRLRSLPGAGPRLAGIVDREIPLSAAVASDAMLTGLIEMSSLSRLSDSLGCCERRQSRAVMPERRELEGVSHDFATCTPDLFVPIERLAVAASHNFSILLVGETGTGKTTLARIIHELSPRRNRRFLPVACGALPAELIDSELFGHEKGAFTGANHSKQGKFEAAEDGTVLLDEIDVLDTLQQAKLLRVLESGEYERVGSNDTKTACCQTIVASNVPLEGLIESGQFRSDLYYRLDQLKFEIPPLRERPLDIVPLAVQFLQECCVEHRLVVRSLRPDFLTALKSYAWPGNIRELRNEMRRSALFARDGVVTPEVLSTQVLSVNIETSGGVSALSDEIAATERESIERMLRQQAFNRAATARALGISRVTLYNKIRKYRIHLDNRS